MEGVHAADWIETNAHLRRENAARNALPREIAHEARSRIEAKNAAAGLRASIARPVLTTEQLDHQEKELFTNFQLIDEPEGHESEILGESIHDADISEFLSFGRSSSGSDVGDTISLGGNGAELHLQLPEDDDRPLED